MDNKALEFENLTDVLDQISSFLNISEAKIVAVGESSHGAKEFFDNKAEIFIMLAKNHSFKYLAFEDSEQSVAQMNRYIQGQIDNVDQVMSQFYKVWQVTELRDFVEILRKEVQNGLNIEVVGFDVDQTVVGHEKRDEVMAQNIIKLAKKDKTFVRSHNAHVRKQRNPNFSWDPMGKFLNTKLGDRYVNIGQFFDGGSFSAGTIDEGNPENNSHDLKAHKVSAAPKGFVEHALSLKYKNAFIVPKEFSEPLEARSLGWGVIPNKTNEYTEPTVLSSDYDAVIFHRFGSATSPI